jgi:non-heme chloroperoxidase
MFTRVAQVTGAGGVKLHVGERGDQEAPAILFVHGWSQCHLSWLHQFTDDLAGEFRLVAFDLRGHGMSERPAEASAYTEPRVWSADVAAVIEQRRLRDVLLVGWSHGGFVVCDYLREHGDSSVTGINFVGWGVKLGATKTLRAMIDPRFEPHFAAMVAPDLLTNIEGTRAFLTASVAGRIPRQEREIMLGFNMAVPAYVRQATANHQPCDNAGLLRSLRVPVLASHGSADAVVRPEATDIIAKNCRQCQVSLYDAVGHNPFLEKPRRFNRELVTFARYCLGPTRPSSRPSGSG